MDLLSLLSNEWTVNLIAYLAGILDLMVITLVYGNKIFIVKYLLLILKTPTGPKYDSCFKFWWTVILDIHGTVEVWQAFSLEQWLSWFNAHTSIYACLYMCRLWMHPIQLYWHLIITCLPISNFGVFIEYRLVNHLIALNEKKKKKV